jgi:hypothetical protein
VKTHFAVFADLVSLALAAVNMNAIAMDGMLAVVAAVRSLIRIQSGRHVNIESGVAKKVPAASSHVGPAGRTARCSGRTGLEKADIDSSNSVPGVAVANTVAAAVSDPVAVQR